MVNDYRKRYWHEIVGAKSMHMILSLCKFQLPREQCGIPSNSLTANFLYSFFVGLADEIFAILLALSEVFSDCLIQSARHYLSFEFITVTYNQVRHAVDETKTKNWDCFEFLLK